MIGKIYYINDSFVHNRRVASSTVISRGSRSVEERECTYDARDPAAARALPAAYYVDPPP